MDEFLLYVENMQGMGWLKIQTSALVGAAQ